MMRIGKISEAVLNRSVLKEIRCSGSDLISGPAVGADASVLRAEGNIVVSSAVSPDIDAAPAIRTILAVHSAVNNIAASGGEGRAIVLNLVLPEDDEEAVLKTILRAAEKTAESLGLSIAGGHTTVSRSVRSEMISVTGIGGARDLRRKSAGASHTDDKICEDQGTAGHALSRDLRNDRSVRNCSENAETAEVRALSASESEHPAESGKSFRSREIVMTKSAGAATAMLLAAEREEMLSRRFTRDIIGAAKKFRDSLSIVPEAEIAGADPGTTRMHDVSEGGVFGALWEMAEAEGAGLEISLREIPIRQETVEICEFFDLNPYQSYSEGSLLILTENGRALTEKLENAGIPARIIGRTTPARDRILHNQGEIRYLDKPQQDVLYKLFENAGRNDAREARERDCMRFRRQQV
jgi:hydrogenase expression/formation protein HypE